MMIENKRDGNEERECEGDENRFLEGAKENERQDVHLSWNHGNRERFLGVLSKYSDGHNRCSRRRFVTRVQIVLLCPDSSV
jgi:hypothetical protein